MNDIDNDRLHTSDSHEELDGLRHGRDDGHGHPVFHSITLKDYITFLYNHCIQGSSRHNRSLPRRKHATKDGNRVDERHWQDLMPVPFAFWVFVSNYGHPHKKELALSDEFSALNARSGDRVQYYLL
jgi:hypothetical protein